MPKWNASVGLQLTIDYEDIEADTEEIENLYGRDTNLSIEIRNFLKV